MPQEIITKMGTLYKPTSDEKLRQKDQELLAILYSLLSVDNQAIVKSYVGQDYISYLERKADRIKAEKNGTLIDISKINT